MIAVAGLDVTLKPAQGQRVGRQAQISFGLPAAGGKPQKVGDRIGFMTAVRVMQIGQAGQVEQDEGQLEQTPAAVLGRIERRRAVRPRRGRALSGPHCRRCFPIAAVKRPITLPSDDRGLSLTACVPVPAVIM